MRITYLRTASRPTTGPTFLKARIGQRMLKCVATTFGCQIDLRKNLHCFMLTIHYPHTAKKSYIPKKVSKNH